MNSLSKIDFESLSQSDLEHADSQTYAQQFEKGLSEKLIRKISTDKNEPAWLLNIRLTALKKFKEFSLPSWGPDISHLDFENIRYFSKGSITSHAKTWEEVNPEIKRTFERLKIPEQEEILLAGVGAQYESENIYHNLKPQWENLGVIFEDFDVAVQKYPEMIQKYLSKCVPIANHKFSALHYAIFSGGTFLYVPQDIEIDQPLQAYFRMNSINQGQFEHTLIVIEKNAKAHYIEGCSAPKYGSQSLHVGCVEVFVNEDAQFRYSSVENWSKDTFNLNTKRSIVQKNGKMKWVGGNLGSGVTMLYPCTVLAGENARTDHLGIAFANAGQTQDIGAKIFINAKNCRANVVSKSLSKDVGISTYRGQVFVNSKAENSIVTINCDALMFDDKSISNTIPEINCHNTSSQISHEASAGKISEEVMLFFESHGISEEKARGMIVNGFLDEIVKTLPLEFASELNRLIELGMENSIG